MTYDKNGLGIAEMTYLSVNYPEIFETVWNTFDENEEKALDLARKAIKAIFRQDC